jgi:hypothetical protein
MFADGGDTSALISLATSESFLKIPNGRPIDSNSSLSQSTIS